MGKACDLAKCTWTSSRAWDINNLGQVVGSFTRDAVDNGQVVDRYTTEGAIHPFSWRCGLVKEFADAGEAYVVNALGCIGGWVEDDGDASDPWLHKRLCSTTLPEIDTEQELNSAVEGLNDCLVAVGWSNHAGELDGLPVAVPSAVSWSCGTVTMLPLPKAWTSASRGHQSCGRHAGEVGTYPVLPTVGRLRFSGEQLQLRSSGPRSHMVPRRGHHHPLLGRRHSLQLLERDQRQGARRGRVGERRRIALELEPGAEF